MVVSICKAVRVAGIRVVNKPTYAREYKARCNLDLATLVPELVLDFSPREKPGETERALTSELRNSFSPLFSFPTSY